MSPHYHLEVNRSPVGIVLHSALNEQFAPTYLGLICLFSQRSSEGEESKRTFHLASFIKCRKQFQQLS